MELWAQARARFGGDGDFLFGEFGAADIMFAPVVHADRHLLAAGRALRPGLYRRRCFSHPFMQDWIAGAQEEEWVIEQFEQDRRPPDRTRRSTDRPARARDGADRLRQRDAGARARCSTCWRRRWSPLGFAVERFVDGEPPDGPVENLLAVRGDGGRTSPSPATSTSCRPARAGRRTPFAAEVRGGLLYGRGAVDMKGAIAAFVAAAARRRRSRHDQPDHHRRRGRPGDLRHPRADRAHGRARLRPDCAWSASRPRTRGSATRSRSAGAARSISGSTCPGGRATSPTRTSPTIRSPGCRGARRDRRDRARRRHRLVPAVEHRDHRP